MNREKSTESACGCCDAATAQPDRHNRPGQSQLSYRIGTHAEFLERMLARLPRQEIPDGEHLGERPLARLTTRSTDDTSVALLDAWAMAADVLGFYQERIANEGFLRTATERRSILELARAIGYELNPGLAAATYLAFTVDDGDATPDTATVKAGTQVQSIPAKEGELPQTFETSEELQARVEWNTIEPLQTEAHKLQAGSTSLYLKGVNLQLAPGDALLIVGIEREQESGNERWDLRLLNRVEEFREDDYTLVEWEEGLGLMRGSWVIIPPAADETAKVYVFRRRLALFGHNAPDWKVMPVDVKKAYKSGVTDDPSTWGTDWPDFDLDATSKRQYIDGDHPEILASTWLVLSDEDYTELYRIKEVVPASRTGFALTAKTTRVTLDTTESLDKFNRRAAVVLAEPEQLQRAEKPLLTRVEGNSIQLAKPVTGLRQGQPLVVSGKLPESDDAPISEVAFFAPLVEAESYSELRLKAPLENSYVRSSVTLYANVVAATHGETVAAEVLGSGDGARTQQRFGLKNAPLTYVSAATAGGAESTLELRVNDLLWQETASLYGKGSGDKNYIVRIDDDAKAAVIFGDGRSGTRLPTGPENVRATYRFGIGSDGEVGADTLSLMKQRPFGVRGVTNPVAAGGAADPEKLENARRNAPLTVLTLDRIVSLRDFEDFARAFAGIGKAQAVSLWNGEGHLVHITLADDDGDPVPPATMEKLRKAVDGARDPSVEVVTDNYQPLGFHLAATVLHDAAYLPDKLRAAIEEDLKTAFAFGQRSFGQPVTAAQVIGLIQQAAGVAAVDLDALYTGTVSTGAAMLTAKTARRGENGEILAAQLLLLEPAGILLNMKSL